MSEDRVLGFGDYCYIEQKRYVGTNDIYRYKVIGTANCNYYRPAPVNPHSTRENGDMALCVKTICCGVMEDTVETFRISDLHPMTYTKKKV